MKKRWFEYFVIFFLIACLGYLYLQNQKLLVKASRISESNSNFADGDYQFTNYYFGQQFPNRFLRMLGDQKSFLFSYDKPNIIVLVAKSGCSRCTRSLLESLRDFMNASEREFKCDVSVICKQDDIYEAAILKKIIPSRFQYLYDENSNIFKWYKSDGFPAIFVVDTSGKIVLCHHPNPDYSELTDRFFYMTQRYLAPNKNVE